MKAADVTHLGGRAGAYVLFGEDGYLYCVQANGSVRRLVHLPDIDAGQRIKLYTHGPWVCVTERFGTRAALVHLESLSVRAMQREDYHAGISSYSIGFVEQGGRVLLICQTRWNRLDVVDAATGECLTDGGEEELDYFHSLLHISPDGAYCLSNGWMWTPVARIGCHRVDDLLARREEPWASTDWLGDYNWDRPCAFIGEDRFVVAADDKQDIAQWNGEDIQNYVYRQLRFYRLSAEEVRDRDDERILTPERTVPCDAFTPDKEGGVHGELFWNADHQALVALTDRGAFALSLTGEVLEVLSECRCVRGALGRDWDTQWRYDPRHHLMYRWSHERGAIEQRRFCTQSQ